MSGVRNSGSDFFSTDLTHIVDVSSGGYDGGSRLGLVERYCPKTDAWTEDQQMCFPRDGLAVSTFSIIAPPMSPSFDDGETEP